MGIYLFFICSIIASSFCSVCLAVPASLASATDSPSSSADSLALNAIDNAHSWEFSGAMLSLPRSSIAAASVGHMAFFAGGRLQNDTYTDVVDVFDRRTGKWSVSHLSMARSEIGAGSVSGRYAIFAGGLDSTFKPLSLVDVYDTKTNKWTTIHLDTPRGSPRIMDLGSVTAIVGGLSGDLQYLSKAVEYMGTSLDSAASSLQTEYPQFGVAVADKTSGVGIYTSGYQNDRPGDRFNDFEQSNQTSIFTVSGSSASIKVGLPFPSPRWGAGGATANGLFAFGGGHVFSSGDSEPSTTVVDRVDLYDAKTGQWSSNPLSLSVPRDYPLVQAVGDYIVFAGGTDESKDLDILDTRTGSFVEDLQHRPALHTLRTNAAAVTIDNCLLIIAGGLVYQGANATASVEMFNACRS
ncbi:hypothetical protein BX070DRAFT_235051 [Coemansia spiralis]|nr:hypothetical protein BX070DRAFT_235051 [Coemansia spiralis]